MKISIIIPTYEMHGKGIEYLGDALRSILEQTYKDYEVIISDHSIGDNIEKYIESFNLDIKYFKYTEKRGNAAANYNNAIKKASGDIIKPLAQDDYFYSDDALEIFSSHILNGGWVISGRREGGIDKVPNWIKFNQTGRNTVSGPSCIVYKKCDLLWNENLIWFFDCDLYYKLRDIFGNPIIDMRPLIFNRIHNHQFTNHISKARKKQERKEFIKKWL